MKKSLPLLCSALLACAVSVHAQQSATDAAQSNTSLLHPPTSASPSPSKNAAAEAKPLEASLATSAKGKPSDPSASSFTHANEKVYLQYSAATAKKGQVLGVAWLVEDAKGYKKNQKLAGGSGALPGPGAYGSYFLPTKDLPAGKYRADISLDGKLMKSMKFTLK